MAAPSAHPTTLTAQGLTRRPWFEDMDLELAAGAIVCLRGPTGSGKSLLLRALADLDPLDGGRLMLDGVPREELAPTEWRRRVLYLHQSAPRFPGTVRENLARIEALARIDARAGDERERGGVDELLAAVGLDPGADAERLSGGEAQLLALARALLTAPDVFLLDEASAALDAASEERFLHLLRPALERGASALWVTHSDALAERLEAEVIRLGRGSPASRTDPATETGSAARATTPEA